MLGMEIAGGAKYPASALLPTVLPLFLCGQLWAVDFPDGSAAVAISDERISGTVGTVLLVEDEDMLRHALSTMLRKHGFSVIEADNGSAALDLVRSYRNSLEVILLDLTIPGAPSSEVVAQAHQIRPGVTVVLMSAYSREMVPPSLNGPFRATITLPDDPLRWTNIDAARAIDSKADLPIAWSGGDQARYVMISGNTDDGF